MGFTSHYFLFQTFILATLLDTPPWSMGVTGTVEVVLMKQVLSVLWTEDWSWLAAQWFFHDDEHSDDQCSKNNTNQRLSSKSKIKWWKQSERPEISRESPHWHLGNKANPSSKQIQLHSIPHTVNQARPASIVFGIYCYAMKTSIPQWSAKSFLLLHASHSICQAVACTFL